MPIEKKKKIIVFPAESWQGQAACRALSQEASYEVIGIARSPSEAQYNVGAGNAEKCRITFVQGDFTDREGYREHLQGAHGIFFNTDVSSLLAGKEGSLSAAIAAELAYGNDLFEECLDAGIKHIVFSGLFKAFDFIEGSNCISPVTFRDALVMPEPPRAINHAYGYWENLQNLGMIQDQSDGTIKLGSNPDSIKSRSATTSTVGTLVKAIFDRANKYSGKKTLDSFEEASWGSVTTRLAALSGKDVGGSRSRSRLDTLKE